MGSTVSITNRTDHKLHVSLKQLTPLYFKNFVEPNETVAFDVGKVWFTIEVKMALKENQYNVSDNVIPITLLTVSAATLPFALIPLSVISSVIAPVSAAAGVVKIASAIAIAKGVFSLSGIGSANNVIKQLKNKPCVSMHGVYAGNDINVEIVGGPPLYDVLNDDGTIFKVINEDEICVPFQLKFMDKNELDIQDEGDEFELQEFCKLSVD